MTNATQFPTNSREWAKWLESRVSTLERSFRPSIQRAVDGIYIPPMSVTADPDTGVLRDANGRSEIEAPTTDPQIANKAYVDALVAALVPPGLIMPCALATAPSGWLMCNTSDVSRTTYAALFGALNPIIGDFTITIASPGLATLTAHGMQTGQMVYLTTTGALPTGLSQNTNYWLIRVSSSTFRLATSLANALAGTAINTTGSQSGTHTIRTTYGVGNGSTTFTLPGYAGKALVGVDTGQTEFAALGQTGGEKTHLNTAAESGVPAHTHTVKESAGFNVGVTNAAPPGGGTGYYNRNGNTPFSAEANTPATAASAHNNLQPYATVNYIIKT